MAKVVDVFQLERRKDRRRQVAVDALLDGVPAKVDDVSLAGVGGVVEMLGQARLNLKPGDLAEIVFPDGTPRTIGFQIEILRFVADEGTFGGNFRTLNDEQYRLLEGLVLSRRL